MRESISTTRSRAVSLLDASSPRSVARLCFAPETSATNSFSSCDSCADFFPSPSSCRRSCRISACSSSALSFCSARSLISERVVVRMVMTSSGDSPRRSPSRVIFRCSSLLLRISSACVFFSTVSSSCRVFRSSLFFLDSAYRSFTGLRSSSNSRSISSACIS